MKLFDTHTHVHFEAYKDDRDEVIKRAIDSGVSMINVGTQRDTSIAAIELAKKYPENLWATVGLHPIHTQASYHDAQELGGMNYESGFRSREEIFDYDFYKKLAEDEKVVGIGECGLDYYRNTNNELGIRKQEEAFRKQIELAKELKKPLMIHCREAFSDLIKILQATSSKLQPSPGIVHFFSGTTENAKDLMDLGFSFSFGGVATFAREYEKLIKYIPIENILLETDAPYVAPIPYRGKRNEPAYVIEVARKISRIKGISEEKVADTTFQNAKRIFIA